MSLDTRAPLYGAGTVVVVPDPPREPQPPRNTYRGPSGLIDGPEEREYAAELAALRARHAQAQQGADDGTL